MELGGQVVILCPKRVKLIQFFYFNVSRKQLIFYYLKFEFFKFILVMPLSENIKDVTPAPNKFKVYIYIWQTLKLYQTCWKQVLLVSPHTLWKWVKSDDNRAHLSYNGYVENYKKCENSLTKYVKSRAGLRIWRRPVINLYNSFKFISTLSLSVLYNVSFH